MILVALVFLRVTASTTVKQGKSVDFNVHMEPTSSIQPRTVKVIVFDIQIVDPFMCKAGQWNLLIFCLTDLGNCQSVIRDGLNG
jgi:hypothetical protein